MRSTSSSIAVVVAPQTPAWRYPKIAAKFYLIYEMTKFISVGASSVGYDLLYAINPSNDALAPGIVIALLISLVFLSLLKSLYRSVQGPILHPLFPSTITQDESKNYRFYGSTIFLQRTFYLMLLLKLNSLRITLFTLILVPILTLSQAMKELIVNIFAQWESTHHHQALDLPQRTLNCSIYFPIPRVLDLASLMTRLSSVIEAAMIGLNIYVALAPYMPAAVTLLLAVLIALPEVIFQRTIDMDITARFYHNELDYSKWMKILRLPIHLLASAALLTMRALHLNTQHALGFCKILSEGFMGYNISSMLDTDVLQPMISNTISTVILAIFFTVASLYQGYMKYIAAQKRPVPDFLLQEEEGGTLINTAKTGGIGTYLPDFFKQYDAAPRKLKFLVEESNRDCVAVVNTAPSPSVFV